MLKSLIGTLFVKMDDLLRTKIMEKAENPDTHVSINKKRVGGNINFNTMKKCKEVVTKAKFVKVKVKDKGISLMQCGDNSTYCNEPN